MTEELHSKIEDLERQLAQVRRDVWGDNPRRDLDPPVIYEARRGKWLLRTIAGIAIGAVTCAGYMIRDVAHNDGQLEAEIAADKASILFLEAEFQVLLTRSISVPFGGPQP